MNNISKFMFLMILLTLISGCNTTGVRTGSLFHKPLYNYEFVNNTQNVEKEYKRIITQSVITGAVAGALTGALTAYLTGGNIARGAAIGGGAGAVTGYVYGANKANQFKAESREIIARHHKNMKAMRTALKMKKRGRRLLAKDTRKVISAAKKKSITPTEARSEIAYLGAVHSREEKKSKEKFKKAREEIDELMVSAKSRGDKSTLRKAKTAARELARTEKQFNQENAATNAVLKKASADLELVKLTLELQKASTIASSRMAQNFPQPKSVAQ